MRAKVFYDEMKTNPPPKAFCNCSNDIWTNGILEEIAFVAETARLFGTDEQRRLTDCAEPRNQYYFYYNRVCVGKCVKFSGTFTIFGEIC